MELETPEQIEESIRRRLVERKFCQELMSRIPRYMRVKQMRAIDLAVMLYIENATFPRVKDLVEDLGMRQSEASEVVAHLVENGRIKRSNVKRQDRVHHPRGDGADGRERYLEVTPKGQQLLAAMPRRRKERKNART